MEKGISTKSVPTQNVFTIKEDGTTTLVWGGKEDIQHVDALQAHLYTLLCQHLGPATTQDDKNKQNTLAANVAFLIRANFSDIDTRCVQVLRSDLYGEKRWITEHKISVVYQKTRQDLKVLLSVQAKDPPALVRMLKRYVDEAVNEILSREHTYI